MSKASKNSIIHEHDQMGNHRIVIMTDGKPTTSQWFSYKAIAHFKGLYAATDYFNGNLPAGVFRVSAQKFETLSS